MRIEVVAAALAQIERSQAWLARRLGIAPSTLTLYLQGKRRVPDRILAAAAAVLGVREAELRLADIRPAGEAVGAGA